LRKRVEKRAGGRDSVPKLRDLEVERKGYLRQNARGRLSDSELDAMLSDVDAQREQIVAELRAVEDAAAVTRQIQAARDALVHEEWYEDPDAVQPHEYLSAAASQEEIRQAYRRFGARFEVGADGVLTLRLSLALDRGALQALHLTSSPS
jgi:hypothetical protein